MAVSLVRFLDEWKEMRTEPIMRTSSEKKARTMQKLEVWSPGSAALVCPAGR